MLDPVGTPEKRGFEECAVKSFDLFQPRVRFRIVPGTLFICANEVAWLLENHITTDGLTTMGLSIETYRFEPDGSVVIRTYYRVPSRDHSELGRVFQTYLPRQPRSGRLYCRLPAPSRAPTRRPTPRRGGPPLRKMKPGVVFGYWGGQPPADLLSATQEAERLGYDSVWSAESWGNDAFTPLAWLAAQTSRIKLGTSVVQLSARTPTAAAMATLTLDHLSQGRVILGLGVSGPQVVEGWYGQPFGKPLAATAD